MLSIFISFIIVAFLSVCNSVSYKGNYEDNLFEFKDIRDLKIFESDSGRLITKYELQMNYEGGNHLDFEERPRYLSMSFKGLDRNFRIELSPAPTVLHRDLRISVISSGKSKSYPVKGKAMTPYQGTLGDCGTQNATCGWASITFYRKDGKVTANPTNYFEGVIHSTQQTYFIHSISKFNRARKLVSRDRNPSTVLLSQKVIQKFGKRDQLLHRNLSHSVYSCGTKDFVFRAIPLKSQSRVPSAFFNFPKRPDGCPDEKVMLYMGVAADCTYTQKLGGVDEAISQILSVWNQVNALYSKTFNVPIGVAEIIVYDTCDTKNGKVAWNQDCSDSYGMEERLSDFSKWRGERKDDKLGLWHLLTACTTLPVIGLSWSGLICEKSSFVGENGRFVSGSGVSALTPNGEYEVVAHEIGHSFGAPHDCTSDCNCKGSNCLDCCPCPSKLGPCNCQSQFIMNPTSDAKSIEFSPCSISQVCSLINFKGPDCLKAPGSMTLFNGSICGNGIKEGDEECDCGTAEECAKNPCCLPNCKLKAGASCNDGNGGCCKKCQIVPRNGLTCRPAKSECDVAEKCDGISIECPPDKKVIDGAACNISSAYCASGVCTNRDIQCRQLGGKRIGSTGYCRENNVQSFFGLEPTSCSMNCQGNMGEDGCYPFQSFYLDGTNCAGGRCYGGSCQTVGVLGWIRYNLQICLIIASTFLAVLTVLVSCCCSCCAHGNVEKENTADQRQINTNRRQRHRNHRGGHPSAPSFDSFGSDPYLPSSYHASAAPSSSG